MKNLLRIEEAAMFLFCIYLLHQLDSYWWAYLLLVLGPDVGMLGYLINQKAGAVSYNVFHHKGIAVAICATGIYFHNEALQIAGLILFGHSSMDRMFGYGLKYFTGFKHTHLGVLEKGADYKHTIN